MYLLFCVKDFYQMFLYYVNTTSIDHLWSLTTGGLCQQLITSWANEVLYLLKRCLVLNSSAQCGPFAKVEV